MTRELGLADLLEIHTPVTALYYRGGIYPLDSPLRVLRFPHLSIANRVRMGAVLAYLRYHPLRPWRRFDGLVADEWLARWMGHTAYGTVWQPMLEGKFGKHYREVNLAWFWARVFKRTRQLGYYRGGFQAFVDGLAAAICAARGDDSHRRGGGSDLPDGGGRLACGRGRSTGGGVRQCVEHGQPRVDGAHGAGAAGRVSGPVAQAAQYGRRGADGGAGPAAAAPKSIGRISPSGRGYPFWRWWNIQT